MQEGRRLGAIMFTDMVGYTALSQANESLALKLLESHRSLIRPLFTKHNGREIKTIGDAFLVEFESALQATECAVELQQALHEREEHSPERVLVRVGIHVGDVVHREGDVYGDAVNIASRIYPLASGGEICISAQVYDQVRNKIPFRFVKLEPKELKNVAVPIDVYKLELPWEKGQREKGNEPLPSDRIAVLPFVNISPDPNDEYFADGLTEELITSLSLVKGLKVIARTSVMNYKKKEMNVSVIGRELGVGTVVEGSVRKAGNRIRVTVQVIEVDTEEHLWASKYDASLDDVFAVQGDIADKVALSLPGALRARHPVSPEKETQDTTAYMNFLQGRDLMYAKEEEPLRQSLQFFQLAMDRDQRFARAYVGMAQAYLSLGSGGFISWAESIDSAKSFLSKALAINENLAEAHSLLSRAAYMGDEPYAVMESEAKRAIELNPNLADAYQDLADVKSIQGFPDEWVRLLETAYQLDPLSSTVIERLSGAYMYTGKEAEALNHLRRTLHLNPLNTHRWMSLYYIYKGNLDDAERELAQLEALAPTWEFTLLIKGYVAALRGNRKTAEEAITALDRSHKSGWARSSLAGFIRYALGDTDEFFRYMFNAAQDHTLRATDLLYSPLFDPVRADPRFKEVLEISRIQLRPRDNKSI
jgi:adenylate cyclase